MNAQDFINDGYKRIEVGSIDEDWANDAVQKKFTDSRGTCYFITVYFSKPVTGLSGLPTARAQFDVGQGTVNIDLFNFTTIKACDDFFKGAWFALGASYYDLN